MKLSQAIREGAKLRPQGTGELLKNGRSCALGSAYEATYGFPDEFQQCDFCTPHNGDQMANWLRRAFPVLNIKTGDEMWSEVFTMIWHLNDTLGWTREQIADWVEQYESKLPQKERETDEAYATRMVQAIVSTADGTRLDSSTVGVE